MSNFKALLDVNADTVKAPPSLPEGNYHGRIMSFEFGDANANKTPYARFGIKLHSAGEDIAEADLADIDLTKRRMTADIYLQTRAGEDTRYRLTNFLKSLGIDVTGRSFTELMPDTIGANVILYIEQYFNPNAAADEPARNRVRSFTGEA